MLHHFNNRLRSALESFAGQRRGLVGSALLRVGLASVMLTDYVWHLGIWKVLWGATGQLDYSHYLQTSRLTPLSLYAYSPSDTYSAIILGTSILVALAYLLGICPRVTCWLFAATTYANVQRNPLSTDAGENLLDLMAFLLCFLDTSEYFCLAPLKLPFRTPQILTMLATMVHNSARFLVAWQVCMLYFWAAFWKLGGDEWRNGTALYHVLHIERFQPFPQLSLAIAADGPLVIFLTYFTLAFQVGFPFLMWNQRVKPLMVLIGVTMHLGIAVLMGLVSFSATMICADLSILNDAQFAALMSWVDLRRLSTKPRLAPPST